MSTLPVALVLLLVVQCQAYLYFAKAPAQGGCARACHRDDWIATTSNNNNKSQGPSGTALKTAAAAAAAASSFLCQPLPPQSVVDLTNTQIWSFGTQLEGSDSCTIGIYEEYFLKGTGPLFFNVSAYTCICAARWDPPGEGELGWVEPGCVDDTTRGPAEVPCQDQSIWPLSSPKPSALCALRLDKFGDHILMGVWNSNGNTFDTCDLPVFDSNGQFVYYWAYELNQDDVATIDSNATFAVANVFNAYYTDHECKSVVRNSGSVPLLISMWPV